MSAGQAQWWEPYSLAYLQWLWAIALLYVIYWPNKVAFVHWLTPLVVFGVMFQNKSGGSCIKFKNKEFLVQSGMNWPMESLPRTSLHKGPIKGHFSVNYTVLLIAAVVKCIVDKVLNAVAQLPSCWFIHQMILFPRRLK